MHLGENPVEADDAVSGLSVAVTPLAKGEFYHFGTSGDVVDSMYELQNVVVDQTKLGYVPSLAQPRQFVQNSEFGVPVRREENHSLWVENSCVPSSWKLTSSHVITGVPENKWELSLPEGTCLDFVPLGADEYAIRVYGFSDCFRGSVGKEETQYCQQSITDWFKTRCITFEEAGITHETDLQLAQLFPVLKATALEGGFIQWLIDGEGNQSSHKETWLSAQRISARELAQTVNLERLYTQRKKRLWAALPVMASHGARSLFYKLDLDWVAREYYDSGQPLCEPGKIDTVGDPMLAVHDAMFRSRYLREAGDADWQSHETAAFGILANVIVERFRQNPVMPRLTVTDDQIVWGRSPARIDLAGGWSDTPPYCIENGGSVVNIAININGQPPVQVFARTSSKQSLTIRSIDLGVSDELTTYEEVSAYNQIGSGFSVARAAFALAGFHPDFNGGAFDTLEDQLKHLGGGIEISLLAAIPKGSGLGTSSILAGTLLSVLSEICGLGWDVQESCGRVSALEQMLGSGGGWQDQFGGLLPGVKLIETTAGFMQSPAVRWLPGKLFRSDSAGGRMLLYYTGITRVARDVLGEIVRGMFLNEANRLQKLGSIGRNARSAYDAIQRNDYNALAETIDTSWQLNQALDTGTNTPEVQKLVEMVDPHLAAVKLAGAGGGGFMYMLAKTEDDAQQIRSILGKNPPNERARFVDMAISETGLQITTS